MHTKDYYLSLISTQCLTQIDIPLSLLEDNDTIQHIIKYRWKINTNISDYYWANLVKY